MNAAKLFDLIFGCRHPNHSWPMLDRRTGETTVACLECGAVFLYDWKEMKRGQQPVVDHRPHKKAPPVAA